MTERSFRVESGANQDGMRFTVTDVPSGETLASFRLDVQQAWDLLRGGSIRIDGKATSHLDRIGKTMINEGVEVPREITDPFNFRDGDARLAAGASWAEEQNPDWESYEPKATNRGTVRVVMRKWVEQ